MAAGTTSADSACSAVVLAGRALPVADPEPVADCGLTEGEVAEFANEAFRRRDHFGMNWLAFVRRIAALGYARGWEARGERDAVCNADAHWAGQYCTEPKGHKGSHQNARFAWTLAIRQTEEL